jgi:hypothetical protein
MLASNARLVGPVHPLDPKGFSGFIKMATVAGHVAAAPFSSIVGLGTQLTD